MIQLLNGQVFIRDYWLIRVHKTAWVIRVHITDWAIRVRISDCAISVYRGDRFILLFKIAIFCYCLLFFFVLFAN